MQATIHLDAPHEHYGPVVSTTLAVLHSYDRTCAGLARARDYLRRRPGELLTRALVSGVALLRRG